MGITGLVGAIAGWLMPEPAPESAPGLGASRVNRIAAGSPGVTSCWERRVLDHCDGRSVTQIVEALYLDQIRAGAAAADIGFWKGVFDRSVLSALGDLARGGYIRLQ